MGETLVTTKIYGPKGSGEVEALVDTGATFTKVSQSFANRLGLQVADVTEVQLADGRLVKRGLALADVKLAGVRRPVLIALGEDGEKPLLGYTTLQSLGFKVNPLTRSLERTLPIEY